MNYLLFENISKSYGDKILFENINLSINKGDKIGLIAKNGSGKTTLLRVISGDEAPEGENAKILIHKDIKTAFLEQEPFFNNNDTLLDAIFDTDDPKINAIKKYEEALVKKDNISLEKAIGEIEDLKAWNIENEVKEILYKFKIPELNKKVNQISGGQKKRLALAKIIIQNPDFLILDEPTNHLDIDMIEWLEEYLSNKKMTIFIVTHDRYFLENTCNRIVELENGNLYSYSGNYQQFLIKKSERKQNELVVADKMQKLFKKELEWLRRQPKARGTKSKSRIERAEQIKQKANKQIYNDSISIDIETQRLGSKILELYNINKSYGDIKIVKDFSYKFKKFEKVGIVGDNGVGKSTFINILMGLTKPDSGKVVVGETVEFGNFSQHGLELNEDKRVVEVIRDIAEFLPMANGKKLTAEQLLEKFLFARNHQQVYVSQLSGGEKRRLQLLTVLMKNPNFLILDEPTNDLDIVTLNILEDYLLGFKGNLIIITHDRYFMDKLTDHLFIMTGEGEIKDFNGTYSDFRSTMKKEQSEKKIIENDSDIAEKNRFRKEKKQLNNEISRVIKKIEAKENEKAEIMKLFEENTIEAPDKINELGMKLNELNTEISKLETHWENLMEQMENLESKSN
ncbi:MAG TPA: ABC transporter ATP-binding protein [Bacteroidetes bacterium]|nr:ABC transporter ATP-binding protein [Bacteroidota bacterium]